MARNCEKHFVGLNRIFLEEQWKKDKERKRPYLQSLNTGAEIKKWIPSIKRELNYCLQQLSGARGHDYTDAKIKEFEERVQYLEREHKRFIQKLRQLDPSSSGVPWEARPYKRKNTQDSHCNRRLGNSKAKKRTIEVCQELLDEEIQADFEDGKDLSPLLPAIASSNSEPQDEKYIYTKEKHQPKLEESTKAETSCLGLVCYDSSDSDDT
ncbi:uncharacterized protein LOC135694742 isoform X1 [Rhopilema esculentum]|uniref:uncharacterized protein LOC135694742 isoform X1 n=1 Tax=Rhopilema esculentum TaxID=499914 RepID=UPI0031D888AE